MSILAAIRREEKKVKKQLAKLQHDLIGLQSAAQVCRYQVLSYYAQWLSL